MQRKTNTAWSLLYGILNNKNHNQLIDKRRDWWLSEVGVSGGGNGRAVRVCFTV